MTDSLRQRLFWYSLIGISFMAPIFWLFYRPAGGVYDIVGYHLGRDFINIWTGPQIVARYGVMTLFDFTAYHWAQSQLADRFIYLHNWGYPLHLLFFIYPLGLLPYMASLIVWTVVGFVAYATTVLARLSPNERVLGLVFLLIASSTLVNVIGGQNGFFTAALLLGGIALLDRRPWAAGVLFGLLTLKPHLGLLIAVALVSLWAWRTIVAAVATTAILVGASLAMWGAEPWITFLTETSAYQYHFLVMFHGFYTYMMASLFASLRIMEIPPDIAKVAQAMVSVTVVATTAFTVRKTKDVSLRALMLTSGTLLASPYVFNYDLPMLTGAMLWAMVSRGMTRPVDICIFGAAWVLPSAVWTLHLLHLGIGPLAYGGVFVIAVMMILQESRATSTANAPVSAAPQGAV